MATKKPRPFTDTAKAKAVFWRLCHLEPDTLIMNLDLQVIVVFQQPYFGLLGFAVLSDVVQTGSVWDSGNQAASW